MIKTRCKESVWDSGGWRKHQCRRNAKKDGYCTQHHPDNVKKRRAEQDRKAEEQWQRSPTMRLQRAIKRIDKLENMVREMVSMTSASIEYRQNTAKRAQVLLDSNDDL